MDWFLSVITIVGIWLIGEKIKWGWLISALASILWIIYAFKLTPPQYGLIPSSVILLFVNTISFIKWSKNDRKI